MQTIQNAMPHDGDTPEEPRPLSLQDVGLWDAQTVLNMLLNAFTNGAMAHFQWRFGLDHPDLLTPERGAPNALVDAELAAFAEFLARSSVIESVLEMTHFQTPSVEFIRRHFPDGVYLALSSQRIALPADPHGVGVSVRIEHLFADAQNGGRDDE